MANGLNELLAELNRLAQKMDSAAGKIEGKSIPEEELPAISSEMMLPDPLKQEKLIESEEEARKRMADEEYKKSMEKVDHFSDSLAKWIEK